MDLKKYIRSIPDYPKKGILFRDITTLIKDENAFYETINQIVDCAQKNNIPSVALTDKSNMFAMVKFFNKCEAAGIKPISGSSIRVIFDGDDSSHDLLCLAKNNDGHRNLMQAIAMLTMSEWQ